MAAPVESYDRKQNLFFAGKTSWTTGNLHGGAEAFVHRKQKLASASITPWIKANKRGFVMGS